MIVNTVGETKILTLTVSGVAIGSNVSGSNTRKETLIQSINSIIQIRVEGVGIRGRIAK